MQNIFFLNNLLKYFCRYAQQAGAKFKPVDVPEMRKFLGLSILTGIVKKPSLVMYWSTDEIVSTPFFGKIMSRNRFAEIHRYLHFNDSEQVPPDNEDRLIKLRPVIDYLTERFMKFYQPHEQISIDEGTLKFKGRLRFRVYNPAKPIKYGIKSYVLADSVTAYCYNLRVYDGIPSTLHDTIFGLCEGLLDKNHKLYMDNFYNSVKLSMELKAAGIDTVGTLRANRGEPKHIRDKAKPPKMQKGELVAADNGTVVVIYWQDKRTVKSHLL